MLIEAIGEAGRDHEAQDVGLPVDFARHQRRAHVCHLDLAAREGEHAEPDPDLAPVELVFAQLGQVFASASQLAGVVGWALGDLRFGALVHIFEAPAPEVEERGDLPVLLGVYEGPEGEGWQGHEQARLVVELAELVPPFDVRHDDGPVLIEAVAIDEGHSGRVRRGSRPVVRVGVVDATASRRARTVGGQPEPVRGVGTPRQCKRQEPYVAELGLSKHRSSPGRGPP